MQQQEIEISILPDGRIEYKIKGAPGGRCESISALLEKLGKVEHEERTSEYYAQEPDIQIKIAQGE